MHRQFVCIRLQACLNNIGCVHPDWLKCCAGPLRSEGEEGYCAVLICQTVHASQSQTLSIGHHATQRLKSDLRQQIMSELLKHCDSSTDASSCPLSQLSVQQARQLQSPHQADWLDSLYSRLCQMQVALPPPMQYQHSLPITTSLLF